MRCFRLLVTAFFVGLVLCQAGCTASATRVRVRVTTTPISTAAEADVCVEISGELGPSTPAARLVVRLPAP